MHGPAIALTLLLSSLSSCARPAPRAEDPAAGGLAAALAGAWRQEGGEEALLAFAGERAVSRWQGRSLVFAVSYGDGAITRAPCGGTGPAIEQTVLLEGGHLTLRHPGGDEDRYTRLPEVPEELRLEPFELGARAPDAQELAELRDELALRREGDQAVRVRLNELMTAAYRDGRMESAADQAAFLASDTVRPVLEEMRATDGENTRWLTALLRDLGWIDVERFGATANEAAFLLVQHSGDLRLMRTSLPLIEAEVAGNPASGQLYALLYDRTQLALCGSQRYGSQLLPGPDGRQHVSRLEDPEHVDERRAALGLVPLEDYLDLFRQRGQEVVVGD